MQNEFTPRPYEPRPPGWEHPVVIRAVLRMMAEGKTDAEIAALCGLDVGLVAAVREGRQ